MKFGIQQGTALGTFEIVSPFGIGGMGEVYRARDTKLGREVAIKVLPDERSLRLVPPLSSKKVPELIKESFSNHSLDVHRTYTNGFLLSGQFSENPERVARFEREARLLAALNHPNIATVHSVEEADGVHFITMELVKGKTLTELLPKNGFPH